MGGVRRLTYFVNAVVSDYFHITDVSDCFSKWEGSEAEYLSESSHLLLWTGLYEQKIKATHDYTEDRYVGQI